MNAPLNLRTTAYDILCAALDALDRPLGPVDVLGLAWGDREVYEAVSRGNADVERRLRSAVAFAREGNLDRCTASLRIAAEMIEEGSARSKASQWRALRRKGCE